MRRLAGRSILVTGASGFLGSHVCPALMASGARVRAVVRSRQSLPLANAASVILADLEDTAVLRAALLDVDLVVHLAGRAHIRSERSAASRRELFRANADGTAALMSAVVDSGVRRFLQVSSVAAVSGGSEQPISEQTPPQPATVYGRSKLEADKIVEEFCATAGIEYAIIRPPMIYGPRMKGNPLNLFRWIHAGFPLPVARVRNRRTVLYVGNFVEAIIAVLAARRLENGAYLLGDREAVSTPELVRVVARSLNVRPRLVPFPEFMVRSVARIGDALAGRSLLPTTRQLDQLLGTLVIDSSRLARVADFHQPFTLMDGMNATADWYLGATR